MTQQWRNDDVFITSKRRRRRRFDVMKTLLLRCVPAGTGQYLEDIQNNKDNGLKITQVCFSNRSWLTLPHKICKNTYSSYWPWYCLMLHSIDYWKSVVRLFELKENSLTKVSFWERVSRRLIYILKIMMIIEYTWYALWKQYIYIYTYNAIWLCNKSLSI